MSSILEGVMQSLGQEGVSAIASRLGINASQAEQAVQSALPLIVGSMAKNSATPRRCQRLAERFARSHQRAADCAAGATSRPR